MEENGRYYTDNKLVTNFEKKSVNLPTTVINFKNIKEEKKQRR